MTEITISSPVQSSPETTRAPRRVAPKKIAGGNVTNVQIVERLRDIYNNKAAWQHKEGHCSSGLPIPVLNPRFFVFIKKDKNLERFPVSAEVFLKAGELFMELGKMYQARVQEIIDSGKIEPQKLELMKEFAAADPAQRQFRQLFCRVRPAAHALNVVNENEAERTEERWAQKQEEKKKLSAQRREEELEKVIKRIHEVLVDEDPTIDDLLVLERGHVPDRPLHRGALRNMLQAQGVDFVLRDLQDSTDEYRRNLSRMTHLLPLYAGQSDLGDGKGPVLVVIAMGLNPVHARMLEEARKKLDAPEALKLLPTEAVPLYIKQEGRNGETMNTEGITDALCKVIPEWAKK